MSHNYYEDVYAPGHIAGDDISKITTNFNTLRAQWADPDSPVNQVAGMVWYDTDNKLIKIRNQANSDWLGSFIAETANVIAIYNSSTDDGWTDSGDSGDKILGIKGGSVMTTGGVSAGQWDISDLETDTGTGTHGHQFFDYVAGDLCNFYDSSGAAKLASTVSYYNTTADAFLVRYGTIAYVTKADLYTDKDTHSHTVVADGGWRPAAAVVTMQYMSV